MSELVIQDLAVRIGSREIVRGVDLRIRSGEVHVIMGPNGSGKSTLAHALAGRPGYAASGSVSIDGVELLHAEPSVRAAAGLVLALQQPIEIPGVSLRDLLTAAGADAATVAERLRVEAAAVGLDPALLERFVNVDLSGGERKRAEVVQLAVLRPKFALLDEIDSGLDVDALGAVARRLSTATTEWGLGVLAITHFSRLLQELPPTAVHVMVGGRLVASGGPEVAGELEAGGYGAFSEATG